MAPVLNSRRLIAVSSVGLFGVATIFALSRALMGFDLGHGITAVVLLFCLAIASSVLSAAGILSLVLAAHGLVAVAIFLITNAQGFGWYFALVLAVAYLGFQLYTYWLISYFERERLRIHWVGIFRAAWYGLSWFTIVFVASTFVIKLSADINAGGFLKSFIERTEPILVTFNLPSPSATVESVLSQQAGELVRQAPQSSSSGSGTRRFLEKSSVRLPNELMVKLSLQNLNEQLKLDLRGKETVGEVIVLYLKRLWAGMSDQAKLAIRIVMFSIVALAIQPFAWVLGNLLSFVALPLFVILERCRLFERRTETVTREVVSL